MNVNAFNFCLAFKTVESKPREQEQQFTRELRKRPKTGPRYYTWGIQDGKRVCAFIDEPQSKKIKEKLSALDNDSPESATWEEKEDAYFNTCVEVLGEAGITPEDNEKGFSLGGI